MMSSTAVPRWLNAALAAARGDFCAFPESTGRLPPHALLPVAERAVTAPRPDLLYTDEDVWDSSGRHRAPDFKAAWNPTLLLSGAFPGHLTGMPDPFVGADTKFDDGTPPTPDQYARDVTAFLAWVANPELEERKRLGILVDLAHGTPALVDGVLQASDAAPVWSHSWISAQGGSWTDPSYIARSLSPATARTIAARGGAVGLWTVRVSRDPAYPVHNATSYADEIIRMCTLIGPRHVAFGTDMEGAGPGPILSSYVDLREVADQLVRRGLAEAAVHDVFIGNYARLVKAAMAGAASN